MVVHSRADIGDDLLPTTGMIMTAALMLDGCLESPLQPLQQPASLR